MALADTAKLVASLELQDKFSKPLAGATGALGAFEAKTSTLGKVGEDIGRGIRNTTTNLARIGVVGAGVLTVAITNGIRELEKLESATTQTNAVLESTQSVSGQTAESIRALAEKYEGLNATIDDKVIQSGENLLLTFTNIRKDAFEPALEAALNMNQALGGGEEGLQNTVIQVGKALQDPIRGLTNLRRVGVNFSEQQKTQIKDLVAQNRLYDAQQIILGELATEFGGSFAKAGDTATAKFAKVRDAVEDAQAALATAFLPVLEKVADKLGTFLADPATVQRIQDFGGQLAGGLDKVLEIGGSLPWAEIGNAFTIVGAGSKALLDAFLGLPPWVQTAVLTGWGLNKLTGGALGDIAGTLTKALVIGSFGARGSSAANPVWVQSALGGTGAQVPTPTPGKDPWWVTLLKFAGRGGGALAVGEITGQSNVSGQTEIDLLRHTLIQNGGDVKAALQQTGTTLGSINEILAHPELQTGLTPKVLAALDAIDGKMGDLVTVQPEQAAALERLRAGLAAIPFGFGSAIAHLPPPVVNVNPNINVSLTSNVSVSVSNVVRTINSYTAAIGSGPGGAINPAL